MAGMSKASKNFFFILNLFSLSNHHPSGLRAQIYATKHLLIRLADICYAILTHFPSKLVLLINEGTKHR